MVNTAITNAGFNYVSQLDVAYTSATEITVSSGASRDVSNKNDIRLASDVVIRTDRQGLNGLDQGAIANSTLYNLWFVGSSYAINNSGGFVLSLASNAYPLIPGGYDMYHLAARGIRIDGSGNILPFHRVGEGLNRVHKYDTPINVLSAGNATTFTDVDASAYVPGGTTVMLRGSLTPAVAGDQVKLRVNGSAATDGNSGFSASVMAVAQIMPVSVEVDDDSVFEYLVSAGGDAVTLDVVGFVDIL